MCGFFRVPADGQYAGMLPVRVPRPDGAIRGKQENLPVCGKMRSRSPYRPSSTEGRNATAIL
ncbi:MAG: hypothetical protein LBR08_13755 [Bacteroidales bacterium]|nr:hypothetical protein [Bacteroidales bacterium]